MFENLQDTILFRDTLASVARNSSGGLCDLEEKARNIALNNVQNCVKAIFSNRSDYAANDVSDDIQEIAKKVEIEQEIHERLHAAVFFATLNSYGITSEDANSYYGSISFGWPTLDFKFYVELNFKYKWSEYFIQCALQLPSDILVTISKYILNASFEGHIKYYSWHLVLQTVLLKLGEFAPDKSFKCPFHFDFKTSAANSTHLDDKVTEKKLKLVTDFHSKSAQIMCLEELFILVCEYLQADLKTSDNINPIKILLHATKALMESQKKSILDKRLQIFQLLDEFLSSDINVEKLKSAINSYSYNSITHVHATAGWGIPENYLILLVNYYCCSVSSKDYLCLRDIDEYSEVTFSFPMIVRLLSPFTQNTIYPCNDHHLELLYKVVQLRLKRAPYASEILLKNHKYLEKEQTLEVLEENSNTIDIENVCPLILEVIAEIEPEDQKIRLLKLFYKILLDNPITFYNLVLEYILSNYGFTDLFRLPDFDQQLSLFMRKTSTANKAENVLLLLFVQSPRTTLKSVIQEVLSQGIDGKPLIQVLKHIPQACSYRRDSYDLSPLVEILKEYFESDILEAYESKNFATLLDLIMEVHLDTKILWVDIFIQECILSSLKNSSKTELVLRCLNVVTNHPVSTIEDTEKVLDNSKEQKEDKAQLQKEYGFTSETLKALILEILILVNSAVCSGSGRRKESALAILSNLERDQYSTRFSENDKVELQKYLAPLDEVVKVYAKEFLPADLELMNLTSKWILSCKTSNFSDIEDKFNKREITYIDLLNIFVQILPHCTLDEWKNSVDFAERICKYSYFTESAIRFLELPFQLSESEEHLYAVISCFITSLQLTLSAKIKESIYANSCFCNCLMKVVKEKGFSPQLVLTIFLDLCYLMNSIPTNLMNPFASVLFELKDILIEKDYLKLIASAVRCLNESAEKTALLQKMNISV